MHTLPTWIFYLIAAAAGLELGGLATLFIQRWIDEKPILKPGKSVCPSCGSPLRWRDTIPLLSYFLLRGRCRYCETSIGPQYILVEVSCMAWALAAANHFGPTGAWVIYLVLGVMLITGSFIDFETFLLPNRITLGGAAVAIAACFILDVPGWQNGVLGSVAGGVFFWVLQQVYQVVRKEEGLGTGDVKLMYMIGAMVGFTGLPLTLLVAAFTSAAAGIAIVLKRDSKDGLKTRIPFGPFLSLGCFFTVLYGARVMSWWNHY